MRLSKKNKQKMKYSLQGADIPVYETDDDGNIIYFEEDGVKIPLETGETTLGYSEPVEFEASLSYGNGEAETQEYGFSIADYNAVMIVARGTLPIKEGSLIWTDNEVVEVDGIVDPASANLRVVAKKPSLNYDRYLLRTVVQNG